MRASHFTGIAVALTTFVAPYSLSNAEQPLRAPSANQLENIQESTVTRKSYRRALKEEEEAEDQLFGSKPVRLEKYDLPADDDLNSSKPGHLSYLADYVYSEVPSSEKPAAAVLDSLRDIPIGTPIEEIRRASDAFGLNFNFMKAVPKSSLIMIPSRAPGRILVYSN
jgi:hypothetical protein